MQRRGAEAGRDRAAQGEVGREVIPARQLARLGVAEVGIVLEPHGPGDRQLVGDRQFDIGIGGEIVAIHVHFVRRLEAGEALGPARQGRVRPQRPAVVAFRLARLDLIILPALLQTPGQVQRPARQAGLELTGEVGAQHQLVIDQAAGIETGQRRGAIGGVQRILGAEIERVAAIDQADVGVPSGDHAAQAAGQGRVLGIDRHLGQEAVRIDGRDIVDVVRQAREGGAGAVAVLITGPAIGLPAVPQTLAGVGEDGPLLDVRIAEPGGHGAVGGGAGIIVRAVGRLAVQIFRRQGQEAVVAQGETLPGRGGGRGAVLLVALAARGLHRGQILAIGDAGAAAAGGRLQPQVHHPGDGVRAVLGRGPVAQHLDPVQGRGRNGVQIHGGRAAADDAVGVDQGRGVAARAVDQDQGLVGRQAAQGRRTDRVAAVIGRGAREGQGRHGLGQGCGELGRAPVLQALGRDHIDGGQGVEARAIGHAGAGDDDLVHGRGLIGEGFLSEGGGRAQQGDGGDGGEKRRRGGSEGGAHLRDFLMIVSWRARARGADVFDVRPRGLDVTDRAASAATSSAAPIRAGLCQDFGHRRLRPRGQGERLAVMAISGRRCGGSMRGRGHVC